MSPELLDLEQFGFKNGRPTKESDCYTFRMVILEVLTGQAPFPHYTAIVVARKVVNGECPERPQGPEAVWFMVSHTTIACTYNTSLSQYNIHSQWPHHVHREKKLSENRSTVRTYPDHPHITISRQ